MSANAEQRATRQIAVALGVTTASGARARGACTHSAARTNSKAILLALALGGLGVAFVGRRPASSFPKGRSRRTREPLESSPEDIEGFARDFDRLYEGDPDGSRDDGRVGRRRFIIRMFGAAAGALGLAALFPIASLGPRPGQLAVRHQVAQGVRAAARPQRLSAGRRRRAAGAARYPRRGAGRLAGCR